jgi:hypothetical protein
MVSRTHTQTNGRVKEVRSLSGKGVEVVPEEYYWDRDQYIYSALALRAVSQSLPSKTTMTMQLGDPVQWHFSENRKTDHTEVKENARVVTPQRTSSPVCSTSVSRDQRVWDKVGHQPVLVLLV